jgi:thioester reductase-like protein
LPIEEIRKPNVLGTRNILELAVQCQNNGKLKKVNYLSTAYICGDFKGFFKEEDLDVGQGFQTTYVQSKFEAEKLVDEYRRKGIWIDIFRPPLVLGESSTGKTFTFRQSVYQLLHIWNSGIYEYFPGKGMSINIEFVDLLCEAIFIIFTRSNSINRNYHPFRSSPVNLETILDIASKSLGFKKPELISERRRSKINMTPAQKMILQNNILLYNYDVKFETEKTIKDIRHYGYEFSKMDSNLLQKTLEYCTNTGFLKQRPGNVLS